MRSLAAILCLGAAAACAGAQPEIDAIFAPLADAQSPGAAVLVRRDGKTVFERGYGVRDLRTLAPIDARTDFRLASFSKQFTAMSIMLLAHDRKLRYDQRLTDFFPGFPEWARAITVRHLLTHTSGLPDYEGLMHGGPWTATRQIKDDEVLQLLQRAAAPKFAAGTSWAYSNSAYVVLGLIAAKVSAMPFPELLRRRIFRPLHMDATLAHVAGADTIPNRAFGHSKALASFRETDQSSTSATLGDGGIYSNLADLAKWDDALAHHSLLSAAEMQAALTPVRLADGSELHWPAAPDDDNLAPGKPVAYGFGWFLDPYRGRERMWHSGSTIGFRTAIDRFPRDSITIIVLANRTDLDAPALALKAADALLNQN